MKIKIIDRAKLMGTLLCMPMLGAVLIFQSERVAQGLRDGIRLCMDTVIPSLFAFMVFCELLSRMDGRALRLLFMPFRWLARLYGLPEVTAPALCLGVIGGYPIGARMAAAMKKEGKITAADAERLLCAAYGCSPLFLAGIGALVFGSAKAGLILWGCQLGAIVPVGFILCRRGRRRETEHKYIPSAPQPFSERFVDSVMSATRGMGVICGFVLAFSVVSALLGALTGDVGRWISALCEVSVGCSMAAGMGFLQAMLMVAGCCSLGGVSVWMQNACFLRGSGVSMRAFYLARMVHLPFSLLLSLLAERVFRLSEMGSSAVFSSFAQASPSVSAGSGVSSVFLVICCLLLLIGGRGMCYNIPVQT